MALVEVDPISRIEGHLGVELDHDGTSVTEANVHGNLWRGFENFLIGREPNDAITFTQRICGVCPLPHATASTFAIDSVLGYSDKYITFAEDNSGDGLGVPKKAVHVRNLVYSAEFLMSHITHFYHLVALSYVQGPGVPPWTPYFDNSYYSPALLNPGDGSGNPAALPGLSTVWDMVILQYVEALRIRRLTFEAGALFAGRMPMTSSFVAGGVTIQDSSAMVKDKCKKFYNLIAEVGDFIVKKHVPLVLALGALYPAYDNQANATTAWGTGVPALQFGLSANPGYVSGVPDPGIGGGHGNFLAWGAFPDPATNNLALKGGYKIDGSARVEMITGKADRATAQAAIEANLVEDVAFSRYVPASSWGYNGTDSWAYPGAVNRTEPVRDASGKYSWIKAPRWKVGSLYYAMEVGPFARLVVNGLYPVDGSTIASTLDLTAAGMFDYLDYVADSGTALDNRVVDAGLATALAGAGLATVDASGNYAGIIFAWISTLKGGLSTMDRLRARGLEALYLVQAMLGGYDKGTDTFGAVDGSGFPTAGWVGAFCSMADTPGETFYKSKQVPVTEKVGYGVSEAPRGGLAHFVTINQGKISSYQCVVPTTWNASPKDNMGALRGQPTRNGRGPIEQSCVGSPYALTGTPGVEALRCAQSFDPCIACAVH